MDLFKARRPQAVDAARDAARGDYVGRGAWFSETQAMLLDFPKLAEEAGRTAYILQRARQAELDDPEPRANLRQSFCCMPCHVWDIGVAQNRP